MSPAMEAMLRNAAAMESLLEESEKMHFPFAKTEENPRQVPNAPSEVPRPSKTMFTSREHAPEAPHCIGFGQQCTRYY